MTVKGLLSALGVHFEKVEVSRETGLRLKDKVAIITGGDTGIGKSICIAMAREGAKIVIDYRGDPAPANALVEEISAMGQQAHAVGADVTKPGDAAMLVASAVQRFGGVDILINNAGMEEKHPFLEMPLEVFERVLAVNLTGVWLCTQNAARRMATQGRGGRIITISSIHEDVAMPTNAPYCAAKGGVRMLTRTLSIELAPLGITVNNVCPGAIDTPMDKPVERDPNELRRLLSEIPLERMGKPDDVAEMCLYLASDAAAYVTGASLYIDGGMSKNSGSL